MLRPTARLRQRQVRYPLVAVVIEPERIRAESTDELVPPAIARADERVITHRAQHDVVSTLAIERITRRPTHQRIGACPAMDLGRHFHRFADNHLVRAAAARIRMLLYRPL